MHQTNFSKSEYYVSLLYNYLLQRGEIVRLAEMEEYYSYGTPEELNRIYTNLNIMSNATIF